MVNIFRSLFGKQEAANTAAPTLAIDLPFEMIAVPGHEAVAVRERLLAKGGVTPVILGSDRDIQRMVDTFSRSPKAPDDLIVEAGRLDVAAWLALREQDDPDLFAVAPAAWPASAPPSAMERRVAPPRPRRRAETDGDPGAVRNDGRLASAGPHVLWRLERMSAAQRARGAASPVAPGFRLDDRRHVG